MSRASTWAVVRAEYADATVRRIGGALPMTAIDTTGELHCADGQVLVGEFTAAGVFRLLELV